MLIKPMIPTLIKQPFDDPEWIYELKWDGYRSIADIGKQVNLYSRNSYSFNDRFKGIRESLSKLPFHCILDGEVVLLDKLGRADFNQIQNFWFSGKGYPVFYVFDILKYKSKDLMNKPLIERKELLRDVLPDLPNVKYVDYIEGDGVKFFELCCSQEIEGIVAKKKDSIYIPGTRTKSWLKIKSRKTITAIAGGYKNGVLIVCEKFNGGLRYIGGVKMGLKTADLKLLKELEAVRIEEHEISGLPENYHDAVFIHPHLRCEIEFLEWTEEHTLRQAGFKRFLRSEGGGWRTEGQE